MASHDTDAKDADANADANDADADTDAMLCAYYRCLSVAHPQRIVERRGDGPVPGHHQHHIHEEQGRRTLFMTLFVLGSFILSQLLTCTCQFSSWLFHTCPMR